MHSDRGSNVLETPGRTHPWCFGGETSLLSAYRNGEGQALRLVESWIRTAVSRTKRELLRERSDVVQEVHLRILTNLRRGSFRGDSSFKTYVWAITRYTSLAFVKDERKHLPTGAREPEELATLQMSPEQRFIAEERASSLARVVRGLPVKQRRLFQLLYCQGLDYRSAGRELGIPVGTVKSRASRFRSALTRRVQLASRFPIIETRASDAAGTRLPVRRRAGSAM